jgi:hypothetical protein
MTKNAGGVRHKLLTRCLAVTAMLGLYVVATVAASGLVTVTTVTSAEAQRGRGGGGRGGGGRGVGRGGGGRGVARGVGRGGRGRGRGWARGGLWYPWIGPGICHHPYTSARVVCPLW